MTQWYPRRIVPNRLGRLGAFALWLTRSPRSRGPLVRTAQPNSSTGAGWITLSISQEEASDWGWTVALHPEDRGRLMDSWRHLLAWSETQLLAEILSRRRRNGPRAFGGPFPRNLARRAFNLACLAWSLPSSSWAFQASTLVVSARAFC